MELKLQSWCRSILVLLLSLELKALAQSCTCPGVTTQVSGHNFCFQILHSSNSTWSDADQKCASLGGFLAFINSSSIINSIKPYVQANYQLPLLTGGLLGNAEYQLIALMCPNNTFMSLLNTTIASEIINNSSSSNGSCLFLETSDWKLHYGNCNSTYDILCQIPMDDTQVCGVMMQCKSSSTSSSSLSTANWSSFSTQSTPFWTSSTPMSTPKSSSISSLPNSSNATSSRPASQPTNRWSSSTAVSNSAATHVQNNQLSMLSNNSTNTTPNSNQNTTTANSNQSTTTPNPNQSTTTANSNQSTTTPNPNQSSTVSSFLSSISTGSTKTSRAPLSSTTPFWFSTQPWPVLNNTKSGCDSGYTKIGSWCLPWWAWLVFGLLVFLVFFTLAICLVFMCVGRKKKVASAENYERLNTPQNEYNAHQVRPSSEPPSSIYDNKTDYLTPTPYSAPNNQAPVYI